ncbi:fibronectin-like [Strongylocentrotus purpuratus]|uniref:Fibronectin type-III domain-containing protein n=1 Tax=Strongylocentrotus purpuratus TaxID=7668 RepID=A0A7M7NZN6_STRPU|nr:fibronectin-like [Strongylocentrotus purpuratus]
MSSSTTQIEVSWEPSSSPLSADYYIIRYSLYQKLACQSPETTPTEFEVNTNVTQYTNLAGLEPYSRYQITVTAVNGAGQSEPTIGYSNTSPGPPSNITNVRVNPERTSPTRLGFTWQPLNCRNVNGVFSYYYARIYKDGDRINAPAGTTYLDDDMSYSSVEFNGLEACTMYELRINAVNRGVGALGNPSHAIGVTGVTFTSASSYATGNQPSLTVQWSVPSQCNVDYYRVSYQLISRKACQDVPVIDAPVLELNVTSNTTHVSEYLSDLEYYATYSISIIAVIRRAESLPMNVSGDTRDGDPSAIESVSYTSTAHSLRFVWEEPSCESLHGAFDRYEYDLYDPTGGGRYVRYPTIIRRNNVHITGLDACTEYRFRIRVVTTQQRRSEWHMEMAMTNISAPGMPVITELTPHQEDGGTTGLTVSWQPPSSPPCQPTHYEIKYYVLQGDMCEDTSSDRIMISAGTVNGSTFTFNVLELRPNSEYRVFVRGRTSSGYGDADSLSATTGYSHPTGPSINIQSTSIKKRSVVFTWEKPECGDRNGPISSYEVMLSNYTGGVVYHGNVSGPEHNIFGLIPYSNYSIRIRAWNYELAGEYGPAIWAQTDEAKPAPPIRVNLPSSDQESITVDWMSPNPPLGRIIGYYIKYWETFGNSSTPTNVSIPCRDGLCSDINYRLSTAIPELQADTNYSVQVMAETIRGIGDSSPDPPVVRITSKGRPACVQALRISSSITTVVVSWELSSSLCSPDYYIIRYSLLQKLACQSPETTQTEFEVNTNVTQYNKLVGLEPYSRYKITVTAVNGAGQSEPTIGYSETRPGPPSNITNVRVNPERTSPTRLGFTWQPLNCRNVNGVFWYYYPRIYKDGDRSNLPAGREYLDDDISDSSVEFNGLEACTMYELSIHAGNRDVSTPGNLSNAIGVTGATFTSASAYATGNQLRVHWSVPSQCNVEYYRLSYQLISRKACHDVPIIDAPVYELNVTSVSTDVTKYISNLEYYATYNISIIAVIMRAESLPMNISEDTLAGDPTGFPTNIQSTSTNKRSIVFTWETPDCGNRNGPISSYEVMLSNSTGDVVYHGNVSASAEPEHEIFELIPSSNYSIRIRAWNYELAGEYGPAIWVQTN